VHLAKLRKIFPGDRNDAINATFAAYLWLGRWLVRLLLSPQPMDEDRSRWRLLRLALNKPHRFHRYRAVTMSLTLAGLVAVPLSGLARVDLWGGGHRMAGEAVTLGVGVMAVAAAIVGFYAVTFLVNMGGGRLFCGFGCPVGQLSRFADAIDAFPNDARARRRGWAELVGFAVSLVAAVSLWWISPVVLWSGSWASLATIVGIVGVSALAIWHGRRWRWGFCRKLCPIGLYYSVVQTPALVHVDFDPTAACTDCGACAGICPVHLDPRHLEETIPSPGGLAFDDLSASTHCLHCGACVEICEHMMRKQPGTPAMGFRHGHPHDRQGSAAVAVS